MKWIPINAIPQYICVQHEVYLLPAVPYQKSLLGKSDGIIDIECLDLYRIYVLVICPRIPVFS